MVQAWLIASGFEIEGGFRGFFFEILCERFLLVDDDGDGESGGGSKTVRGGGGELGMVVLSGWRTLKDWVWWFL
ncbi:hypothetical protein ACFX13_008952 [Malus domestica]